MARQGNKNRPLCNNEIFIKSVPTYTVENGGFISPMPIIGAYNSEVIDTTDGEMERVKRSEAIDIQGQLNAGLTTLEEVEMVFGGVRKFWDNQGKLNNIVEQEGE